LKSSKLGRQDVISKHIADAEDLFNQGKHHPAIGEARCAMQAVIDETVIVLFLEEHGFLTPEEQSAYLSAWGFLSSGNHPGLSSEDEGRIGTIICLEFIQILLLKGQSLLLRFGTASVQFNRRNGMLGLELSNANQAFVGFLSRCLMNS
jgi:hypothetical protein